MSQASNVDPPAARTHRSEANQSAPSRLPLIAVAVLAVAAVGLSVWALVRPAPGGRSPDDASASYSDTQRAESKAKICAAFDVVRKGVTLNTNLQVPGGPDDVSGTLAVAANARLSLSNGGLFLMQRLDAATPTDLAEAVRGFANTLMDVGAAATAGAQNTEPEQAARLRDAETMNGTVARLCS